MERVKRAERLKKIRKGLEGGDVPILMSEVD
jgi:hypothetical protein